MLTIVASYLQVNRLNLNVQKCKAMIFTTKYRYSAVDIESININISGDKLEVVSCVKYLGLHLDNTLNFQSF